MAENNRPTSLTDFIEQPYTCPCCLNKTWRTPEAILKEVESERAKKELKVAKRKEAQAEIKREKLRLFLETHVRVQKQSSKTGKWKGWEWIPRIMLQTDWKIPRHVHFKMIGAFEFSKEHGMDLLKFKAKDFDYKIIYDYETMITRQETRITLYTFWDLLLSCFQQGAENES